MPKRKRQNLIEFSENFNSLFDSSKGNLAQHANSLRSDLAHSLDKPSALIKYIRNLIPDLKNSDARNAVQYITDRFLAHLADLVNDIHFVTSSQIKLYKKTRANKKRRLF